MHSRKWIRWVGGLGIGFVFEKQLLALGGWLLGGEIGFVFSIRFAALCFLSGGVCTRPPLMHEGACFVREFWDFGVAAGCK